MIELHKTRIKAYKLHRNVHLPACVFVVVANPRPSKAVHNDHLFIIGHIFELYRSSNIPAFRLSAVRRADGECCTRQAHKFRH